MTKYSQAIGYMTKYSLTLLGLTQQNIHGPMGLDMVNDTQTTGYDNIIAKYSWKLNFVIQPLCRFTA